MTRHLFLAFVLLLAGIGAAAAHGYKLGTLEIGHPWTRATPPTAPTGGGYLSIKNTGTEPDRLISASSPAAETVQVHEMKMEGNVMRMRPLEGALEIKPGETVTLAPGGMHMMMMGLKGPFKQGERVPLTLVFEKAGKIDIEMVVVAMGATPQHRE